MKRLYQLVAVVMVALFVPLAASMPVAAKATCEIGYTGPNSENMCVSERVYSCSISNDNKVNIKGDTEQESASGSADSSNNGSGGDAVTGSASNNNGVTYTFTIKNGNPDTNEGRVCTASRVIPAKETPETPEQPTPGKGESTAPVQPAKKATPVALPVTSGGKAPAIVLVGSAVVTAGAAYAYRRFIS